MEAQGFKISPAKPSPGRSFPSTAERWEAGPTSAGDGPRRSLVELSDGTPTDAQPEVARIEEAYAKRKASGYGRAYSITDRANFLRLHELQHRMVSLLPEECRSTLHEKRILEVGCGSGY